MDSLGLSKLLSLSLRVLHPLWREDRFPSEEKAIQQINLKATGDKSNQPASLAQTH